MNKIWKSKTGSFVINEMTEQHMRNCLSYFGSKGYEVPQGILSLEQLRDEVHKLQQKRNRQQWLTENCDATESDIY